MASSSFTDSNLYIGIYYYTYFLIVCVIVIGSKIYLDKVRLQHESNEFLKKMENELTEIAIAMNGLKIKYDKSENRIEKIEKVKKISHESVEQLINNKCEKMIEMVRDHTRTMSNSLDEIEHKHKKNIQDENVIGVSNVDCVDMENMTVGIILASNSMNDKEKEKENSDLTIGMLANNIINDENDNNKRYQASNNNGAASIGSDELNGESKNDITVAGQADGSTSHNNNNNNVIEKSEMQSQINSNNDDEKNERKLDTNTASHGNDSNNNKQNNNRQCKDNGADKSQPHTRSHVMKEATDDYAFLLNYIKSKQESMTLLSKKGWKRYLKIMWQFSALMRMAISHTFDTATDIALVIQWYNLYKLQESENPSYLQNIDMKAFFICSLAVITYYRVTSTYTIYHFSHSILDALLQFIFDFYLIKAIYVNVYIMKDHKPSVFVRALRNIEGSRESVFQAVLAMVFLLKTSLYDITTIVSLITSLYSVITRLSSNDVNKVIVKATKSGLEFEDIFACHICKYINKEWLFLRLFRACDIFSGILGLSLLWHMVGGAFLVVIALFIIWFAAMLGVWNSIPNFVRKFIHVDFGKIRFGNCVKLYSASLSIGVRLFLSLVLVCGIFPPISNKLWSIGTIVSVLVLLFINLIILPFMFKFYINKLILPPSQSGQEMAPSLDLSDAVMSDDIEFMIFCQNMNANPFRYYNSCIDRLHSWITKWRVKYAPRGAQGVFVIHRITSAFAKQEIFNQKMYQMLNQWYDHVMVNNNNNNNNNNGKESYAFEKYLVSILTNVSSIKPIWMYAANTEIFDVLLKGEFDFDKYNMCYNICKWNKSKPCQLLKWFLEKKPPNNTDDLLCVIAQRFKKETKESNIETGIKMAKLLINAGADGDAGALIWPQIGLYVKTQSAESD